MESCPTCSGPVVTTSTRYSCIDPSCAWTAPRLYYVVDDPADATVCEACE